jgi:hypothetical protein
MKNAAKARIHIYITSPIFIMTILSILSFYIINRELSMNSSYFDRLHNEQKKLLDYLKNENIEYSKHMDVRLNAVLNGEAPKNNAERLALAQRAYDTKQYATAARLWAQALDADPELAKSQKTRHRYNAACAAALAAGGEFPTQPSIVGGEGKTLDDVAKAKLSQQARDWLKAELDVWSRLLESGDKQQRAAICRTLQHWQKDTDLAGIRDPKALAKLPEEERKAWEALWAEVAELLKKVQDISP